MILIYNQNEFMRKEINFPSLKLIIISFIIFTICAIYITFPLILHISSITTGYGDEYLISYLMAWVQHSVSSNPLGIFSTNIYFPYQNTYAYSELFLTSSILSFPISLIFKEPIASFNFTLISSLILLPFSIFLLSFFLTKNFFVSLTCGILVVFSPVILDHKVHLQLLAVEWVPFSILFFLIFVKEKSYKWFLLFLTFFLLQFFNSFMPAYFIVIFLGVFCIYYFFKDRKALNVFLERKIIITVICAVLLALPVIIPYFQVSRQFNYVRDIRDTIHFALQPEDLIYPGRDSRLESFLLPISKLGNYPPNAEYKPGYLGLILTICCIALLIYAIKNRKKTTAFFNIFCISAFLGLILSFGPFLHLGRVTIHHPFPIPLPYLPFYYLAPGFAAFRNSSRFEVMFVIFAVPAIAMMLTKIKKRTFIICSIVIALSILEFNFPIRYVNVPARSNFPKVFSDVRSLPLSAKIIILPAFNWNMWGAPIEIKREYYSTIGFRKMVNGFSGFSPPPWQDFIIRLSTEFPNKKNISEISKAGVNFLVIDKRTYDEGFSKHLEKKNGDTILSELNKNSNAVFIKDIDSFYIYKIKE